MVTQAVAGKILKGLYAGTLAFLSSLATILQGPASLSAVTAGQWVTTAALSLAAFGGTFGLASWSGPAKLTNGHRKP